MRAMLGTSVHTAVMIVVAEIPRFTGLDRVTAPPTGDVAGFDEWSVCLA